MKTKTYIYMRVILSSLLIFFNLTCILRNKTINMYAPSLPIYEDHRKEILDELIEDFELLNNGDIKDEKIIINDKVYLGEFKLTGYCDCEICQGPWMGTTALGVPPVAEWTVAVDPDVIPLGSFIWIDGHRYHVEDTGSAIIDNKIDIFCTSHAECYSDFCNGYHDVYLEISK